MFLNIPISNLDKIRDDFKKWGKSKATDKQKAQVRKFFKDYDVDNLTKLEASQILNRMFARR